MLFKIVLSLSTARRMATLAALITFLWTSWNDFLWPLITIYDARNNMTL